jgi:surface polysaccharide O-acyltransferase-like enzyme
MFCIVLYHCYLLYVYDESSLIIHKAIQIPLHIGVILFLLISGYFGIKTSIHGFINLIMIMFIYTVPLSIINFYFFKGSLSDLLFISHSPYWFMRQYLFLYLFAPIINYYFDNVSFKKKMYFIIILSFISIYCCTLLKGRVEFEQGKNLVNFTLLYCIGKLLYLYSSKFKTFSNLLLILLFITLNIIEVFLFSISSSSISSVIWQLSFPYYSPLLILNSILIFIIFSKLNFSSLTINKIAKSTLAVYLIHFHPLIVSKLFGIIPLYLTNLNLGFWGLFVSLSLYTLLVMIICIGIDFLLKPIYNYFSQIISQRVSLSL